MSDEIRVGDRPKPAIGQRWRWGEQVHTLSVKRTIDDVAGWQTEEGGRFWDCRFTDGTLEYVGEADSLQPPEAEAVREPWKAGQRRRGTPKGCSHDHPCRGVVRGLSIEFTVHSRWMGTFHDWLVMRPDGLLVGFNESWPSELLQDVGDPTPRDPAVLYGGKAGVDGPFGENGARWPKEPESRKRHRFDRYCMKVLAEGAFVRACVECGDMFGYSTAATCTPDPYWRRTYEQSIATRMVAEGKLAPVAVEAQPEPPTRYDARTLLATPGLGSPSLICPVRGMRGPL